MANERMQPVDEIRLLRAAACDWRLSRGDVGVFAVILEHCDADWTSYPGPTRIGKAARLAPTNVKASIGRLEQFRYLDVVRPGRRIKNRFVVLESPTVEDRKRMRISQRMRREVGMQTGPVSGKALAASRYADIPSTRHAGMQHLGLSARHEVAFKAPNKSLGASTSSSERERQQEEQREREGLRAEYLEALSMGERGGKHCRMMEREPQLRKHIEDLIPEATR